MDNDDPQDAVPRLILSALTTEAVIRLFVDEGQLSYLDIKPRENKTLSGIPHPNSMRPSTPGPLYV
ncbi:hypothetical protein [Arthrobacter sp. RIT-PI-e]|uniref:hypothetical protein n=1 Tax=Arthrobacter sp. RIT-PI-e TaxID=1681197 RepID=UPI00128EA7F6|nr:hypothetical protein [Arthrobacter sp. RIT-PI-e]